MPFISTPIASLLCMGVFGTLWVHYKQEQAHIPLTKGWGSMRLSPSLPDWAKLTYLTLTIKMISKCMNLEEQWMRHTRRGGPLQQSRLRTRYTAAQRKKICRDRQSPEKVAQVNANQREKRANRSPTLLYVFCTQHGREHEVVCTQKSVLSMYPMEV